MIRPACFKMLFGPQAIRHKQYQYSPQRQDRGMTTAQVVVGLIVELIIVNLLQLSGA